MSLFIKDATTTRELNEFAIAVGLEVLTEDIADTMDSFIGYAERKLRGYSVTEVDVLAKAAKNVDSEVKKRETLERIDNALKDARSEMAKAKEVKKKELRLQIEVLTELKTKVTAFKVAEHNKEEPVEHTQPKKDIINLDER